jgi:hypothetical protein
MECVFVFCGNDDPAGSVRVQLPVRIPRDHPSDLGVGGGGDDYRATAREHAGEFRRHYKVSGSSPLRKQMDIGGVEEIIEAAQGLQWEQRDVGPIGNEILQLGTEGTVSAEEEVNARVGVAASGSKG